MAYDSKCIMKSGKREILAGMAEDYYYQSFLSFLFEE